MTLMYGTYNHRRLIRRTSLCLFQANFLQRHPLAVFHRHDLHTGSASPKHSISYLFLCGKPLEATLSSYSNLRLCPTVLVSTYYLLFPGCLPDYVLSYSRREVRVYTPLAVACPARLSSSCLFP